MENEKSNMHDEFLEAIAEIDRLFNAQTRFEKIQKELCEEGNYYNSELFTIMDEFFTDKDENSFITLLNQGQILYRAREINPSDSLNADLGLRVRYSNGNYITTGFDENNSKEAPLGKSTDGRSNIVGVSYLYLADDLVTACSEIRPRIKSFISVAQFQVQKQLKLVDLAAEKHFAKSESENYEMSLPRFFTRLMFQFTKPIYNPKEYKLTQIISDHIRKMGYDGIIYRSFHTGKNNYVIFNTHKNFISYLDSKIVLYAFNNNVFWDFNEKMSLQTNDTDYSYNMHEANEYLKNLRMVLEK